MARKRKPIVITADPQADAVKAAHKAAQDIAKSLPAAEDMPQTVTIDDTIAGMGEITEQLKAAQTESLKKTIAKTGEELQRLMNLPISEIDKLPQETRDAVWREVARQMAEDESIKQLVAQMTMGENFKALQESAAKAAEPMLAHWKETEKKMQAAAAAMLEPIKGIGAALDGIREQFAKAIDADTMQAFSTMATLAPYIRAEADEHPEKYGSRAQQQASADELIAAAARRARADGKEIPHLMAEDNAAQQLEMQLDFTAQDEAEKTRRQRIQEAHERRELAQAEGAILEPTGHIATIAEKGLGFRYFTSAVIKLLPGGIEDFILDDEGRINLYDLTQQGRELKEVDALHTSFLMYLLRLAYQKSDLRETNSTNAIIPVYLPAVMDEWGIDPRPRLREYNSETGKKELIARQQPADGQTLATLRRDKFMQFLQPILNMAGFYGDDLYQIAGFHRYNAESETVYLTTPYMYKLVEYAKLHADKHGAIKTIFHADIMTENQTAVEVANRIAMGVILRGVTRAQEDTYKNPNPRKPIKRTHTTTDPDGTKHIVTETFEPDPDPVVITPQPKVFKYEIRFAMLIKDCPQLQRELDEIRSSTLKDKSQRVNKKLKDTFDAAIRIIMQKSDMPQYYKDLQIKSGKLPTFRPPTNSTLSEKLIITHKGKNPDYTE